MANDKSEIPDMQPPDAVESQEQILIEPTFDEALILAKFKDDIQTAFAELAKLSTAVRAEYICYETAARTIMYLAPYICDGVLPLVNDLPIDYSENWQEYMITVKERDKDDEDSDEESDEDSDEDKE